MNRTLFGFLAVTALVSLVAACASKGDDGTADGSSDLSSGAEAPDGSCQATEGATVAQQLVQECIQVSPATHPPCNVANACSDMRDEIARGCSLITDAVPTFCPSRVDGGAGQTCTQEVGADKADQLVQECLQVSTATHPPCNADNACSLIQDEIDRSCATLGPDAPLFCAE